MTSPFRSLLPLGFLAASSCASVLGGGGVELESGVCTVSAGDLATATRVQEIVSALDPPLRRWLEADSAPAPRIRVRAAGSSDHGIGGLTTTAGIDVYDPGGDDELTRVVGHELVHWHLHHGAGYWRTLPHALGEGLARLAEHWVVGKHRVIISPPGESLDPRALSFSFVESEQLGQRDYAGVTMTGTWVVAALGVDRLRDLSRRAAREGRAVVPRGWIEPLLPPASERATIESPLPELLSALRTEAVVGLLPDR